MPIRTSKVAHEYPFGCVRDVGEPFEVEPQHVDVLLRLGRIDPEAGEFGYVEPKNMAANEPGGYRTRDMSSSRNKKSRKAA